MSFQRNFTKSSIFAVKLSYSVVLWLNFSKISLKFCKIHLQGYFWPGIFQNFRKIYQKFHDFRQLGSVFSENLLKIAPSFTFKYHNMGESKVLLCIYVSFQG